MVQRKQAGERMAELTILQTAMQEYSAEHDGADRIPYSEFNKVSVLSLQIGQKRGLKTGPAK